MYEGREEDLSFEFTDAGRPSLIAGLLRFWFDGGFVLRSMRALLLLRSVDHTLLTYRRL